jgi:hypothetical protein
MVNMTYLEFIRYHNLYNKIVTPFKGVDNKYHFTYITINVENYKYYVGKRSTYDLNDGYVGSGKYLWNAVFKSGSEKFIRKEAKFFNTSDEAYKFEEFLVTDDLISSDQVYNLVKGGKGLSGGYWITDGNIQMRVSEKFKLPNNFWYGRLEAFGGPGCRRYYNPETGHEIRVRKDEFPPLGYLPGVSREYKYIHSFDPDGKKLTRQIELDASIPEGWTIGCGPSKKKDVLEYFDPLNPTSIIFIHKNDKVPKNLIHGQLTEYNNQVLDLAKDQLSRGYTILSKEEIATKLNKYSFNVRQVLYKLQYYKMIPEDIQIN